MTTPDRRYVINNNEEGNCYVVSKKNVAFSLARRWAEEDRITYYVIDTMAHHRSKSLWEFLPVPGEGRPMVEILQDEDCDR